MLRASHVAAAAALALLGTSAIHAAVPGGTPVNGGDRVYGAIDGPLDGDVFLVDAPQGSLLDISVKATGKDGLLPTLSLTRPDGTAVDVTLMLTGQGTPVASLLGVGVPQSGTWVVEVAGFLGTTGGYQATFGVVVERKVRATVVVPEGSTLRTPFTGFDGVEAGWSAKTLDGPGLASGRLCCPHDNPITASEGVLKGRKWVGPRVVLDRGPGVYGIVLEGSPGGPTTVDLRASIKLPKVKKRRIHLGAEPRPTTFDPDHGRDGTRITILGTGFTAESRVLLDGVHLATGTALNGDGSLTVVAPDCPAAVAGTAVTLDVVNADGQTGRAALPFRYLGVPQSSSVSPMLSATEGGTPVVIGGTKFRAGFSVAFGGVPAGNVVFLSPTVLTCTTPAHGEAVVDVVVTDEFGRPGAVHPGFRFADAPALASAAPDTLPSFGGRSVTLTGSHFTPGSRVFVAGVEASSVSVASWSTLSFTAPAGTAGPADVEVRDLLGRSGHGPGLLAFTLSFREAAGSLPAPPNGAPFLANAAASADCDGNGLPDLVLSTSVPKVNSVTKVAAPSTRLLLNNGAGGFTDGTLSLPFPNAAESNQSNALSLGDLDGDGAAEILLSRTSPARAPELFITYQGLPGYYLTETPDVFDPPTLRATRLLDRGTGGSFTDVGGVKLPATDSPPAAGLGERWQAAASAIGDLDGDGTDDLLLVAGGDHRGGAISNVKWIYVKTKYGYYPYYYYYYTKQKALLTQDTWAKGAVRPLMNYGGTLEDRDSGPGLLLDGRETLLDDFRGAACALGDLDGDGTLDAVSVKGSAALRDVDGTPEAASAIRVLRNGGGGYLYFEPGMTAGTYADDHPGSGDFLQGTTTALGDLDGDGDLDLVVGRAKFSYWTDEGGGNRVLPAIRILRNDPSAGLVEDTEGFLPEPLFRTGGGPTILGVRDVALEDLDGDGDLDIVVTGRETTVIDSGNGKGARGILDAGIRPATRILLNDGSGFFADATEDWLSPATGDLLTADAVAVFDVDGDGKPEIALVLDDAPATGLSPFRLFKAK